MNDKVKQIDPIPDEFSSYEEAAEFWDTHDTTDYPDSFETVAVHTEFKSRRYEVEIDEELMKVLAELAQKRGVAVSELERLPKGEDSAYCVFIESLLPVRH